MFVEVKDPVEKAGLLFASLKSVKLAAESGGPVGWGLVFNLNKKKDHFGLGYKPSSKKGSLVPAKDRVRSIHEVFLNTSYVYGFKSVQLKITLKMKKYQIWYTSVKQPRQIGRQLRS